MIVSSSQLITLVSEASMLNVLKLAVTLCTINLSFKNSTLLPTERICVFCTDLRINSDYFPDSLVGEFAKFRKATYSFAMSVCPSVIRSHRTRLPLYGFS